MIPRIAYVALFSLALGFGAGWKTNGWKAASEAAELHNATQTAIINTLVEYDKEKTAKEEVKRENLKIVDRYRRELADFRVRLPAKDSSSSTSEGWEPASSCSGEFAERSRIALERFAERLDAIGTRLKEQALTNDNIVEDCRVLEILGSGSV